MITKLFLKVIPVVVVILLIVSCSTSVSVELNPGAKNPTEIAQEVYISRVQAMAKDGADKVNVKTHKTGLGLHVTNPSVLHTGTFFFTEKMSEAQKLGYSQFAIAKNKVANQSTIFVAQTANGFTIELHHTEIWFARPTYAFLKNKSGEVIPLYPSKFGYSYEMVNSAGAPSFHTDKDVPLGVYTLYIVQMNNTNTAKLTDDAQIWMFELELKRTVPMDLWYDEVTGLGWVFIIDPNPFVVGDQIHPNDNFINEFNSHRNGKFATSDTFKVIEIEGKFVQVFIEGGNKWMNHSWFTK